MSITFIFFGILAILAIASGVVTITSRNPVTSAISLIFQFFMLAGLYLTLQAQFIAVIQILVYAGAIMVLVVFVIMLLNLGDEEKLREKFNIRKPIAFIFGIVLAFQLVTAFFSDSVKNADIPKQIEFNGELFNSGSVQLIGQVLFNNYLFPFEAISLLLLAAIVGAVILAKRKI